MNLRLKRVKQERAKRAMAAAVPEPGVGAAAAVGCVRPAEAGPGGVMGPGPEEGETQQRPSPSQLPESAPNLVAACGPGRYDLWVYPASHARVTHLIKQGREALSRLDPAASEEERLQVLRDTDAEVAAFMQAQVPTLIHMDCGEVSVKDWGV